MKNTIKMSLVAALAVAGLSTTASAAGLEEAIKGVTISGKFEVEYDYQKVDSDTTTEDSSSNEWDYDWDATAKVPVNDNVTAVFGLQADTTDDTQNDSVSTNNDDSDINISKMYFQYANAGATVMVGKQGMAGAPWFDDERASGVVGMYNAGAVTVAAAHFTGNNAGTNADVFNSTINDNIHVGGGTANIANADITAAAIIAGNIADSGINASLWYADISSIADSYSINVNGKFGIVGLDVRHTAVDYGDFYAAGTTQTDATLTKVVADVNLDAVTVFAGYGTTNDDANRGAGTDLTKDADADTNFGTEQLAIDDLRDADAYLIGATTSIDAWKLTASYVDGDYKPSTTKTDFNELLLDVEYKMSKNLTIDAFYSMAEVDPSGTDKWESDTASIALEYKF